MISRGSLVALACAAAAVGLAGAPFGRWHATMVAAALLFAGAVSVLTTRGLLALRPRPPARRRPSEEGSPAELRELAGILARAEVEADRSLRPLLAAIASARLAHHGVTAERSPRRAEALLGTELWEFVRPDRGLRSDRSRRGAGSEQLERMIERLEAL